MSICLFSNLYLYIYIFYYYYYLFINKNRVKVNILTYFNIIYYKSISYKMLS